MRIVVSYRGIPQSKGWATGDMVVKALKDLGHQVFAYGNYYMLEDRLANPPVEDEEYDLLIYMEMNDLQGQYPDLFNKYRFKKTASWLFDIEMQPGFWKYFIETMNFDINFVADETYVSLFNNSHYMPYGCDSELHYREFDASSKEYDVLLIGSDRQERRDLVKHLKNNGVAALLISDVFREDYIDYLSQSWIALSDEAGGGQNLLPMRFFEAPAAGSLLCCPSTKQNMLTDYIGYDNKADMLTKVKDALSDLGRLSKDTIDGQNQIQQQTYEKRCMQILELV